MGEASLVADCGLLLGSIIISVFFACIVVLVLQLGLLRVTVLIIGTLRCFIGSRSTVDVISLLVAVLLCLRHRLVLNFAQLRRLNSLRLARFVSAPLASLQTIVLSELILVLCYVSDVSGALLLLGATSLRFLAVRLLVFIIVLHDVVTFHVVHVESAQELVQRLVALL